MPIRIDGTNSTANPGVTGDDADTGLVFGTDQIEAVTGGTTRFTVESGGNVTIENGNLVLASGSGIDFSATADGSGTTTSELLDDYEEGTWTPTYQALTTDFTSVGYLENLGWYTKVGNTVHAFFYMYTSSVAGGSGNVVIAGLPFLIGSETAMPVWQAKWGANYPAATRSDVSTSRTILYKTNSTTPIQASDLSTANNKNQIEGFIVYQV